MLLPLPTLLNIVLLPLPNHATPIEIVVLRTLVAALVVVVGAVAFPTITPPVPFMVITVHAVRFATVPPVWHPLATNDRTMPNKPFQPI